MPRTTDHKPPAMIHVDLDGASAIYRVRGLPYEAEDDPLFETGLRNCLAFLSETGVKATLFTIAEDLQHPRKRALLEEAVAAGHEIASHSVTHRKLAPLSADDKRREVFDSRAMLTDTLGVAVTGFRAPFFSVDRALFDLLIEAGYQYDSSLFPTADFARRIGVARLEPHPHCPLPGRALLELPLPAYAPLPFPFHPSYSLMLGTWYYHLGVRCFARQAVPQVLLFHLTDFADPLPDAYVANLTLKLFTLSHLSRETKLSRCRRIVSLLQRHYYLTTTRHYLSTSPLPLQAETVASGDEQRLDLDVRREANAP